MKHLSSFAGFVAAGIALSCLAGLPAFSQAAEEGGSSYAVPVPESLRDVAHFQNIHAGMRTQDGRLIIDYQLPPELVGPPGVHIHVEGEEQASGFTQVQGGNGTVGYCIQSEGAARTCLLKYPGLKIDYDKVVSYLQGKYPSEEIERRSNVVHIFKDDPAGLLTLQDRGGYR